MDWHAIFSQSPAAGPRPGRRGVLPRRDRPERALRLHRPAQLRPGRLHGRRRLRARLVRRDLGAVVLARHAWSACCAAVVLALLLGVPTLRLRADYLAIVTIAAAEIIRQTIGLGHLLKYFGGQDGLQRFNEQLRRASTRSPAGSASRAWSTWRPYDFWTLLVCWLLVAPAAA